MIKLSDMGTTKLNFFDTMSKTETEELKEALNWHYNDFEIIDFNAQEIGKINTLGILMPFYMVDVRLSGQWIISENLQISTGNYWGHEYYINYFGGE